MHLIPKIGTNLQNKIIKLIQRNFNALKTRKKNHPSNMYDVR